MAEEKGKFYCPKCNKKDITLWNGKGIGYSIWMSKQINNIRKWQFDGVNLNGGVYIFTEEKCWKTEEERNKYVKWFCSNCNFNSKSFTDYIENDKFVNKETSDNKINLNQKELNEEIGKNKYLENELKLCKNRIMKLEEELKEEKNKYKNLENFKNINEKDKIFIEKENEIKNLKNKLSRYPFDLNFNEKLISIIFISIDQSIHCSIICKNNEMFKSVEKRFLLEYPKYNKNKLFYTSCGCKIDESKNLEENGIKNSDIIVCNIVD